jgi:16S rRNA (cytidine1402-2'-O)-methyltransferase
LLYFIPTPIGNIEDMTIRSLKIIEESEVIFCEDTRVSKRLLFLLKDRGYIKQYPHQFISLHSHNEKSKLEDIDISILLDKAIYMSDAGMPVISDPGGYLVDFCIKNAIPFEILPGANAILCAYAYSGFNSTEFTFFGFLAHSGREREEKLKTVLSNKIISILYEAPHRLIKLLQELKQLSPNRKISLSKELTKLYEKHYRGTAEEILNTLKDIEIKGEWVVVIDGDNSINTISLTESDIRNLTLPKKEMSKLLSKLTGLSPKECYSSI